MVKVLVTIHLPYKYFRIDFHIAKGEHGDK